MNDGRHRRYPFPCGGYGIEKNGGRIIPVSIRQVDTICLRTAMRPVRHDLFRASENTLTVKQVRRPVDRDTQTGQ